ncbi:hypothetical protein KY337_00685 [Candidatus Woesearchaeota archaeon]|nr:hypothetical protein [Candidatus Woesearchaeota archaeon]
MDKVQEYLKEWAFHYIKNKDLTRNNIVEIKERVSGVDLFVEFKDKKQIIIVEPVIKDMNITLIRLNELRNKLSAEHASIIVLNNKQNLETVKGSWDDLANDPKLSIYFVNPLSPMQRVWIIFPYTHARISDKNSLNSLFEAVQEIEHKDMEKII